MKGLGLTRRIALAVGFVAAVLLGAVALLAVAIAGLSDSGESARRAEVVRTDAQRVRALVVDAETAVRGFALTDRELFLEPLTTAEARLPEATAALVAAELPTQRARTLADAIQANASDYLTEYAAPLLETLRTDPAAGRDIILTGAGKRRVDQIRGEVAELSAIVRDAADAEAAAADRQGDRAVLAAILAGAFALALFAWLILYLRRAIAVPIGKAADAAAELGAGDLTVRLPAGGRDETGQLARAFNAMGEALTRNLAEIEAQHVELEQQNVELEQQAAELESQTVELEAQTTELETGQHELTEANEQLRSRTLELEETAAALRVAHARTELFAEVADDLGRAADLDARTAIVLRSATELSGAVVGALYLRDEDGKLHLRHSVGLSADQLPNQLSSGEGLAGRAVTEQTVQHATHSSGALRLRSFGEDHLVRQELHQPLCLGGEILGVVSLGSTAAEAISDEAKAAIERLAEHAAVTLQNAVEVEHRLRLADINRAILDTSEDAIRLVSDDGRILVRNPAMAAFERDILRVKPVEEGGDPTVLIDAVAARTADPAATKARLLQSLEAPEGEYVDEFELVDTHRWVRRFSAPVRSAVGGRIGRITILRETTDQRQAERLKEEMMSTVSHELRTPLSAILGFAELLMARDYGKAERDEYLGTIHDQARRLSQLISDFLDIQRLEQTDQGIDLRPVKLRDLLREEVDLYSGQSPAHAVKLDVSEDLELEADPEHLRRAVANLVSNAIKYSPAGGAVRVGAERSNGDVVVSVEDEGIGIPETEARRVFDRFYRVDSKQTRKIGGTGLGLALVREIARAHGGDVGVESREGQGSRFWLRVPAHAGTKL